MILSAGERSAFRSGDPQLFHRLVDETSPRLLRLVRPFARDVGEAHDLVQETWRRAFERRRDFRGEGSLLGWLIAIARNVARAHVRRRRPGFDESLEEEEELAVPASQGDPERLALRRVLLDAVADLPDRERDTLVLRLVLGCSTRETAERLGCAEGTVKAALAHALAKVRPALEEWRP